MTDHSLDNIDKYYSARIEMVRRQIERRGVRDNRILDAMRKVPRHLFIAQNQIHSAYEDSPLGIDYGQTISQPFIVAYMTELLDLTPNHRVLEVGTGSGYQTAVLAELVKEVFSIEIVPELAENAVALLNNLGYSNLNIKVGDGYNGWPEQAPFDRILVTAAPVSTPKPLIKQVANGGRMVIPVGDYNQCLEIYQNEDGRIRKSQDISVRFVPMTGVSEDENQN